MNYQVSVALKIEGSNRLRSLIRKNGFKLHLRDTVLAKFSPIEMLDEKDLSKEGSRWYVYGVYNSTASFPPQEVLKELMSSECLMDIKLRHFDEVTILPS